MARVNRMMRKSDQESRTIRTKQDSEFCHAPNQKAVQRGVFAPGAMGRFANVCFGWKADVAHSCESVDVRRGNSVKVA